jgi:excisionase family DNA binding protein
MSMAENDTSVVEKHWTVEGAAERLALKPSTIRKWLRDGKLRGLRASDSLKTRWIIPDSALREVVETLPSNKPAKVAG